MRRPRAIFTLDENVLFELSSIAKELGKKKSHIVEEALEYYFDLLDVEIAKKRLKEIKSGKSELVPAEKVWEELGI